MKNEKSNSNRPDTDGFEVGWSASNTRYEMDLRPENGETYPIGATIPISKHPDHQAPKFCLGKWLVIGHNADGTMRLRRDA